MANRARRSFSGVGFVMICVLPRLTRRKGPVYALPVIALPILGEDSRMTVHKTRQRPVVGVSTYLESAQWGVWSRPAALLPMAYVNAVSAAGGIPVLLPPSASGAD